MFVLLLSALEEPSGEEKAHGLLKNQAIYICLRAFRFSSVFLGAELGPSGDHSFHMCAENQAPLLLIPPSKSSRKSCKGNGIKYS